ncbi:MAG: zinc ribbon domain-containing protein [Oscillospiraceae bacterium]|nr:zinc ribbon domain-containing protein [Oscillospiraceae bacterium]MDD4413011.1 zinc ribbon domain-containing protein [Oscillospiraceae bacterium]
MKCKKCGNELLQGYKFCKGCGYPVEASIQSSDKPESFPSAAEETAKSKLVQSSIRKIASNIVGNESFALPTSGRMVFTQSLSMGKGFAESIGPFKFLVSGALGLVRNIKGILKDKKRLILLAVMSLVWLLLMILPMLNINIAPIKVLSFLSFAQGGTTGGVVGILGGSIGKGIVAFFFSSLITPIFSKGKPFGGIAAGFKTFLRSFNIKSAMEISPLLLGAGLSLIAYNFMNAGLTLQNSMIGLVAAFLSVKALSNKSGFLQGFIRSIMSKILKDKAPDFSAISRVVAGITTGFALCIPLTAINIPYIISLMGLALIIASVIIFAAFKSRVEAVK